MYKKFRGLEIHSFIGVFSVDLVRKKELNLMLKVIGLLAKVGLSSKRH